MASVHLDGIRKTFGGSVALEHLDLEIASGEMVALLGPSGCGKTTALRILAGFELADSGRVVVDGQELTGMPPQKRGFGMVFQDYSLFPNMTARDNIGFGLSVQGQDKATRAVTVERLVAVTRLEEHADKFPHQMSGGQKQRVALARALATGPRVLLLDEPLSALDAKVRESLRIEIRRIQQETGVTTLFVTHDQHEAMAVADRVGVMEAGRLVQIDTPEVLYSRPATPFVAQFVGTVNLLPGVRGPQGWSVLGSPVELVPMVGVDLAGAARVVVRPEQIELVGPGSGVAATVRSVSFLGALTRISFGLGDGSEVLGDLSPAHARGVGVGHAVHIGVAPDAGPVTATA